MRPGKKYNSGGEPCEFFAPWSTTNLSGLSGAYSIVESNLRQAAGLQVMILSASGSIVKALRNFLNDSSPGPSELSVRVKDEASELTLPSFRIGTRRLILAEAATGVDLSTIVQRLKNRQNWTLDNEPGVKEIVFGIAGPSAVSSDERVISLGISATSLQRAIAEIVGLPTGWVESQRNVINRILEPLRVDKGYRIACLRVPNEEGEPEEDALAWLDKSLGRTIAVGRPIYLRAEAGKGKSTMFAELAMHRLDQNDGPVPILIPLRNLSRGSGVSWEAIASSVGIVGGAAADFARAVKAGLFILLLDGLDEISGRYDPNIIQQIVRVVIEHTGGESALVAFSGRTTEGMLLDSNSTYQRTIELPEIGGDEFRAYVESVVDTIVPQWPALSRNVGEPIASDDALPDREFTSADRDHLVRWVLYNFVDFGKDRSLFFVQSLACLARDMQLRGNRPIYVRQGDAVPRVITCGLYEACLCAASLACVREQQKVAPETQSFFSPSRQLDVATWLSVLASVDDVTRGQFPTPNELIADMFNLDPVNQAEDLVAMLRQMQKHALLFSASGLTGGDWRPGFLSDWVRSALLVRAWVNCDRIGAALAGAIQQAISVAQKAQKAYFYVFPDVIGKRSDGALLNNLVTALLTKSNAESPEACANFWFLMQGLSDEFREGISKRPPRIVELTEFNEFEFDGLDFGPEFSANLAMFVRTRFIGCRFRNCRFTSCDFTQASFVNCMFDGVSFEHCDGPIQFEDCDGIHKTRFVEVRSRQVPTWLFTHCHFAEGSRLEQKNVPCSTTYGPIASFEDCTCDGQPSQILVGPELGQELHRFTGLQTRTGVPQSDPAIECLRQLLRPFFPSRVGEPGTFQARDYIRSSAIGRGAFPEGSPAPPHLTSYLTAEGFTNGGRQGHLYAPWSEVGGTTRVELRGEFSTFLRNQARMGTTIQRLLEKIRQAANWS